MDSRDRSRFLALNRRLVDQYGKIEVLPGLNVDGALTVSENTADLGGLQTAYDALKAWLRERGRPAPIYGLTQEQRFFVAAAQVWRAKARPEYVATQVRTRPHAPAAARAIQPARNMAAFHDSFRHPARRPDVPGARPAPPHLVAPAARSRLGARGGNRRSATCGWRRGEGVADERAEHG